MAEAQDATESRLAKAAVAAFLAGFVFLALEVWLRGGSGPVRLDMRVSEALAGACLFLGLAIRPRVSLLGEGRMAVRILVLGALAMFTLPSAMLGIYAAVTVTSIGINLLGWIVWALVLLAATLVTLVLLAAVIGGGLTLIGGALARNAIAFLGLLVAGIGMGIANALAGRFLPPSMHGNEVLSFALVREAYAWTDWIPAWNVLVAKLRAALAFVHHGAVISLFLSAAAGLVAGLAGAIVLRRLRQSLMRKPDLRAMLPLAAAPLPDAAPWIGASLVVPVTLGLLAAWMVAVLWVV